MTQNELMELHMNNSNVIVYLKDEQGRFLMVNQRVADILDSSIEDIIGKTDYDFHSKEESDRFRKYDRDVIATREAITIKIPASFSDGEHTFIDHKFPVTGIEGTEIAVGGVAIDISDL